MYVIFKNKTSLILSILLFLLPLIQFLNKINLPQIQITDFYFLLIVQTIFFGVIFTLTFIIYKFFFKNYLDFNSYLMINSIMAYLFFFFKNFKNIIYNKQNSIIDDLIALFFFLIIYFFLIKFFKKIQIFLGKFVFFYMVFYFTYFSFNFYEIRIDKNSTLSFQENYLANFDIPIIENNYDENKVFFIILDGMMNLDLAEKLNIISSKQKIADSLKKNKLIYKDNFNSNYDATYISIASMLSGSYPVTEKSKKYSTRNNFFPFFILNSVNDNNFFQILRKTKKEFLWHGNSWAGCQENLYIKCLNTSLFERFFFISKSFYYNSLYFYFFNIFEKKSFKQNPVEIFFKKDKVFPKNSFNLIHIMNPHPPFFFDDNCNIKNNLDQSDEFHNYSKAYNCLLELINNWILVFNNSNPDSLVFIFGDHGWSFNNEIMESNNINPTKARFEPFFAYSLPEKCSSLEIPNSIVNIMRFSLKCLGNKKIKFLEDLKYYSFNENNVNFGKVILNKD